MATTTEVEEATQDELRAYRIERYVAMGFLSKEAEKLADAKVVKARKESKRAKDKQQRVERIGCESEHPLDYHEVQRAIDAGCGYKLALRIFA